MLKRTLITSFLFLFITLVGMAGWYGYQWYTFLYTPMNTSDEAEYYVYEPGATVMQLAYDLHREGLLSKPRYFIWLTEFHNATTKLKAGEYEIKPDITTPDLLLQKLIAGDVYKRYVTFVEGWSFAQMRLAMQNNPHIQNTLPDDAQAVMAELNSEYPHPEGLFYPNTYQYYHGTSDAELLRRAYTIMQETLQQAWAERAPGLPYDTPYQALIAASLIEKETAFEEEKTTVASVIVNRLNIGMRLQIDPTVIYGLADEYTGKLTRQNMRHDSPYNTYRYAGLPPTPIAMPSITSIQAALNPAQTDYIYFVARGDGSHEFSRTLEEQTAAIEKYLRRSRD